MSPHRPIVPLPEAFQPGPYWSTRLVVVCISAAEYLIALLEDSSPQFLAIRQGRGHMGIWAAALGLAIVAMLALDCLINDLAPTRHKLRCMLRWRPAALMAAAFGDLGMCGAFLATFPGDWAYLLRFFPLAAFLTALAFLDTFARGVFDGH